jgi:hypothetical protein
MRRVPYKDIVNVVPTMRFWTILYQVCSKSESQIALNSFGLRKPKDLNRIAKIGKCHLCMMSEAVVP